MSPNVDGKYKEIEKKLSINLNSRSASVLINNNQKSFQVSNVAKAGNRLVNIEFKRPSEITENYDIT